LSELKLEDYFYDPRTKFAKLRHIYILSNLEESLFIFLDDKSELFNFLKTKLESQIIKTDYFVARNGIIHLDLVEQDKKMSFGHADGTGLSDFSLSIEENGKREHKNTDWVIPRLKFEEV
jgi:hypothetical protein